MREKEKTSHQSINEPINRKRRRRNVAKSNDNQFKQQMMAAAAAAAAATTATTIFSSSVCGVDRKKDWLRASGGKRGRDD